MNTADICISNPSYNDRIRAIKEVYKIYKVKFNIVLQINGKKKTIFEESIDFCKCDNNMIYQVDGIDIKSKVDINNLDAQIINRAIELSKLSQDSIKFIVCVRNRLVNIVTKT